VEDPLCAQVRLEEDAFRQAFSDFVAQEKLTDEEVEALVLDEFPIELSTVLADVTAFTTTSSHGLFEVVPGTAGLGQSAAFLSGCWGRIENEDPFGETTDASIQIRIAEAWRIDLREEGFLSVQAHRIEGVDGWPCTDDNRPVLKTTTFNVSETTASTVFMTVVNSQAAGLDDFTGPDDTDFTLSLSEVGTIQSSVTIGAEVSFLFTVDGDLLVTTEGSIDPENPATDDLDYWMRFDCPR
jgi:hypothetical protein